MAIQAPYFGRDIDEVCRETDNFYALYNKTEPVEDLDGFNPRVRGYGELWVDLLDRPSLPGVYVIAGVSGSMSGVPVAHFLDRDTAKRYAKDLASGMVFAIRNGDRWVKFVNAAHAAKTLDAGHLSHLKSLGRPSGILSGNEIDCGELQRMYESGFSFQGGES